MAKKKVGEDVEQIKALTEEFRQDIEAASDAFQAEVAASVQSVAAAAEAAADTLSTSLSNYSRNILQLTRSYVYELNVILGNTVEDNPHPEHPIVIPPPVEPENPIVIPPNLPTHPIVLPGDPSWGTSDKPENPIVVIPPGFWDQGNDANLPSTGPVGPQPKK